MTRIALLRHFPTDWNGERRLQGWTDRPLTPAARIKLAGLALPAPWDRARLIASPLVRAADTAQILARGRPVTLDPRLVEIGWGQWEGRRAEDLAADPESGYLPPPQMAWCDRPPGGESQSDAWVRLHPALLDYATDEATVLLVTHKALMRVILGLALGVAQAGRDIEIKRGRLYPLTLDPQGMPQDPEPPVRLVPLK